MQSRIEDILQALIDGTGTGSLPPPQSRNEALLMQLNDKIGAAGESAEAAAASAGEAALSEAAAASSASAAAISAATAAAHGHVDTIGPASVATCSYGVAGDASSVVVHIEPKQAGSGDPSPDNVRPISGHTSITINVSPSSDPEDGTNYTDAIPTPPGTVYWGELDFVTGVLKAYGAVTTISSASGAYLTSANRPRFSISGMKNGSRVVSDRFATTTDGGSGVGTFYSQTSQNRILFNQPTPDSNLNSLDAWTAWFTSNPTTVAYELATPVTYQLTPQQITTLLGTNNFMSDAGNVDATIPIDLKKYVDIKIAELQALILNS